MAPNFIYSIAMLPRKAILSEFGAMKTTAKSNAVQN